MTELEKIQQRVSIELIEISISSGVKMPKIQLLIVLFGDKKIQTLSFTNPDLHMAKINA